MDKEEYQKLYMLCKLDCDCGGKYQRCNLSKHKQTQKHKTWVKYQSGGPITKEEYFRQKQLLSFRKYNEDDIIFQQDKKTST